MTFRTACAGVVLVLTLLGGQVLGAQHELDPRTDVYEAIDRWYATGLIDTPLPIIRPYPRHVLLSLLQTVERRATPAQAQLARQYLAELGADGISWRLSGIGDAVDDEALPRGRASAQFRYGLAEQIDLGISMSANAIARDALEADNLLYADRFDVDVVEDNVPTFSVADQEFLILPDAQTNLSYGNERLWVQAGIHRRSFGPVHQDSPVLSSDAPQQAGASFTWAGRRHSFNLTLLSLSASSRFKLPGTEGDDATPVTVGQTATTPLDLVLADEPDLVPGKLLYIQSVHFHVARWLDLGIMEAVVTGPRLEMAYLIPAKTLFLGQALSGFEDNSLLGLTANFRPGANVHIPLMVYVDDVNFNELASFNFDTKIKAAASTAIDWYAPPPVLERIRFSYDIVMPYMYTHPGVNPYTDEPNYLDYRHQGVNLGSGLLPNSDRARLAIMVRPLPRVGLELSGALIRHANASEGLLNGYVNDGGYGDAGRDGVFEEVDTDTDGDPEVIWNEGRLLFNDDRLFLEQDTIEHIYQVGLEAAWRTRVANWDTELSGGVTYQYVDGPLSYVIAADGTGQTVAGSDQTSWFFSLGVVLSR